MTDERWANVAPYSTPDGEQMSFPVKEFPTPQDVKEWLIWSDPSMQAIIDGPNYVEVHDHEDEACPSDPCPNMIRIMAWTAEITDEGWELPPER